MTLGVVSTGPDVLTVSDRDRILQAMADCCAEGGYGATSLESVLERAAVGRESFEALFAGKEDCALAALNQIVSEALARTSTVGSGDSGLERRTRQIGAIVQLAAARASFARLACIDARQGGTARMRSAYETGMRVLALSLQQTGMGTPADAFALAARAALGGAEALARRELAVGEADNLPKLLPDFVYAALVPFVGQREALRQAKLAAKVATEEG